MQPTYFTEIWLSPAVGFDYPNGKAVIYGTGVPVETLQAQLAGATDPMQKSYAGLMLGYTSHRSIDMTATLKTFPLTLRTVEDYARRVLPS